MLGTLGNCTEHGIFHGIEDMSIHKSMILLEKIDLSTIEWE